MTAREPGLVSLVGAGPGDPDLITIGGAARLATADVVVFDRLANPALLGLAKPGSECVDVGKTPDHHTLSQGEINRLLIERARAGNRVVRLKGGDPFVFGRGGEEAQALVAAGVPFEVLPGVTSAVAAPAYAGIPITHRAVASSFAVITGHVAAAKSGPGIDWERQAAGADTLIFLMGASRLGEIAERLIAHGRAPSTPAVVIEWGTLPRQRTVAGTLATIDERVREAGIGAPAVTVVGEVARLRDELRWFDVRPLFGKRVLVTRTRRQASQLSRLLAAYGAEPVELPTIEIIPDAEALAVDAAVDSLATSRYRWCIMTSANAVELFMQHLNERGYDARALARTEIAAIGPGTAAALEQRGVRADLVPARFVAESLADALTSRVLRGARVLMPRARCAREVLAERLRSHGAAVDELPLYSTSMPTSDSSEGILRLRAGEIDAVTFASSSAVRNLIAMLGGDTAPLRHTAIAAIGPATAEAVREAGLEAAVTASTHTMEGLVRALAEAPEEMMVRLR